MVLRGWASAPARFLLEIPGGLHFRSIDAGGVDKAAMDEILVACSSHLEVFSLCPRSRKYHPSYKSRCQSLSHPLRFPVLETANLSRNPALTRFELRVDPDDLSLVPSLSCTRLCRRFRLRCSRSSSSNSKVTQRGPVFFTFSLVRQCGEAGGG